MEILEAFLQANGQTTQILTMYTDYWLAILISLSHFSLIPINMKRCNNNNNYQHNYQSASLKIKENKDLENKALKSL